MNRNLFPEKKIPEVTPEIQAAWDVVADYLSRHPKLTFFVNPWVGKADNKFYSLETLDEEGENVTLIKATKKWKDADKN